MRVAVAGPLGLGPLRTRLDGAPALPPGLGNASVTQLVVGLLDAGHEVVVVTLDRAVGDLVEARGAGLRVLVGPYRPAHRARDAFRAERAAVTALLAAADVELVHAHWTYEFALGAIASGLPTLVTARDWAPTILRHDPSPYRAVRLVMSAAALRAAAHVTAVSPYLAHRVGRWARVPVAVVPNGLDEGAFRPARETLRPDPVLVAANHGFDRRKNTATLLAAFALARRRLPGARLRLVGDGPEAGGAAATWARARGLDPGVTFGGRQDHDAVLALIRDADLFVHPSREEAFGMVLLEAMAQGVPVLAGARSGAVPWVLDGGRAGALADIESPVRLADDLVAVLSDPAAHGRLARAARARATDFALPVVVGRYLEQYERVLRTPTGAGAGR